MTVRSAVRRGLRFLGRSGAAERQRRETQQEASDAPPSAATLSDATLSDAAEISRSIAKCGEIAPEYLSAKGISMHSASAIVNERRLAFLHIPKTAGATVIAVLDQYFDRDEIAFAYNPPDFEVVSAEKRLFRGHMYGEQWQRLFPDAECFTIGRHPTAFMRSMYYWMREPMDWDQHARSASKVDSDDEWLRLDSQKAQIEASKISYVEALTSDIPSVRNRIIGIYTRILCDGSIADAGTRLDHIAKAARCIDACCAVATSEDLEIGLAFLCEHRHWPAPPPLPNIHRLNPTSTPEEDALSARLAEESGDAELYDRIRRRSEDQKRDLLARSGGMANLRSYLNNAHKRFYFDRAPALPVVGYKAEQFWPGFNWGFRVLIGGGSETKQLGASGTSTLLAKMVPDNAYAVTLTIVRAPRFLPLENIHAALSDVPLRLIDTRRGEHGVGLVWYVPRSLVGNGELEITFSAPAEVTATDIEAGGVSVVHLPRDPRPT